MKPFTPALIGAILASGSCVSLAAVAFAADITQTTSAAVSRTPAAADIATASDAVGACHAGEHAHSSTCTCARCAAASEAR